MTRELNRTETLTARKRHGCVICLRWIAPGERYVRWTGIDAYTGDFASRPVLRRSRLPPRLGRDHGRRSALGHRRLLVDQPGGVMTIHAQIGGRWVHVASTFVMNDDQMVTVPEWVWRESDRARIRQMTNQYRRRKRGWRT